MTTFKVMLYDKNGVPKDNGVNLDVEAESMLEAAQKASGLTLTAKGRPQIYCRADVRLPMLLNSHNHFFEQEDNS